MQDPYRTPTNTRIKQHRTKYSRLDAIFVVQQPKSGLGHIFLEVFKLHIIRHTHTHTTCRTPLDEWSARGRGRCLHNTQQTQETNTHALSGIRTRRPSRQEAADLGLRPPSQRDRLAAKSAPMISALLIQTMQRKEQNTDWSSRKIVNKRIKTVLG